MTDRARSRLLVALTLLVIAAAAYFGLRDGGDGPEAARPIEGPLVDGPPVPKEGSALAAGGAHGKPDGPVATKPDTGAPAATDAPKYGGIVIDEDKRPIAGVEIRVVDALWTKSSADRAKAAEAVPVQTTGADGRFVVPIEDVHGQITVSARADGWVPMFGGGDVYVFPGHPGEIRLVRARELRVRVVAKRAGAPIAGARVEVFDTPMTWFNGPVPENPFATGVTDASGSARLSARAGPACAIASADGFAPGIDASLDVGPSGAETTIELFAGGRVEGRFVDGKGAPRSDVVFDAKAYPNYLRKGKAAADGTFVLDGVPPAEGPAWRVPHDRFTLFAQRPGSGMPPRVIALDPPADGATTTVTIPWPDERTVTGSVRRPGGSAVVGVRVATTPAEAPGVPSRSLRGGLNAAQTDERGAFRVEHVAPGPTSVSVGGTWDAPTLQREINVPAEGPVPPLEIVFGEVPLRRLVVHVVAAEGTPAANLVVRWDAPAAAQRGGIARGTTDARGEITLEAHARSGGSIVVESPGVAPIDAPVDGPTLAAGHVEIRLPSGVVEGRVVRPDGTPVQATLRAHAIRPTIGSAAAGERGVIGFEDTVADVEGRFRFLVGPGDVDVMAIDLANGMQLGGPARVRAGDRDVRIVLVPRDDAERRRLAVELVDAATGSPLKDAWVTVRLERSGAGAVPARVLETLQRESPDRAVYRTFFPVASGAYEVVAVAGGGFVGGRLEVRMTDDGIPAPLRLALDRGLGVRGTVRDPTGVPLSGVLVMAGAQRTTTKPDGTFTLTGLGAGDVSVAVLDWPFASGPSQRARAGGGDPLDFVLAVGGAIAFDVPADAVPDRSLRATARGPAGAAAQLDVGRDEYLRLVPSPIQLGRLAAGTWHVEVAWDGQVVESRDVQVEPRKSTKVEVFPP